MTNGLKYFYIDIQDFKDIYFLAIFNLLNILFWGCHLHCEVRAFFFQDLRQLLKR